MMTLATALTRIRYRIGESTASFWTDAELISYVNDSKDDLHNAILTINKDFFQKSTTVRTSQFNNRLVLPSDFQRIKSLRMTTPGLEATIFSPQDKNTSTFVAALSNNAFSNQPYQYMFDQWNCIDVPSLEDTPSAYADGAVVGSSTVVLDNVDNYSKLQAGWTVGFVNPSTGALEDTGVISSFAFHSPVLTDPNLTTVIAESVALTDLIVASHASLTAGQRLSFLNAGTGAIEGTAIMLSKATPGGVPTITMDSAISCSAGAVVVQGPVYSMVMTSAIDCSDGARIVQDMRGWNLELSPAPKDTYDINLCYGAQLPDLAATTDSFLFMDPFTGFILDQATYYALSKGPSGDYQNYGSRAEMKLNRILAVASKTNQQGAEFAAGFLEDSY